MALQNLQLSPAEHSALPAESPGKALESVEIAISDEISEVEKAMIRGAVAAGKGKSESLQALKGNSGRRHARYAMAWDAAAGLSLPANMPCAGLPNIVCPAHPGTGSTTPRWRWRSARSFSSMRASTRMPWRRPSPPAMSAVAAMAWRRGPCSHEFAAAPQPFRLALTILHETGMRAGEVLALNLGDVLLHPGCEALYTRLTPQKGG